MTHQKIPMEHDKKIALVAHDHKKPDLVEWAKFNRDLLAHHTVYATGTTGKILELELGFKIHKLRSGPLGGDQQIGALAFGEEAAVAAITEATEALETLVRDELKLAA